MAAVAGIIAGAFLAAVGAAAFADAVDVVRREMRISGRVTADDLVGVVITATAVIVGVLAIVVCALVLRASHGGGG